MTRSLRRARAGAGGGLVVAIGACGHRTLADAGRLETGLEEVVEELERSFPGEWLVVSALAEGADRLIVERLLSRAGTHLVAVLPLEPDDFEADFATESSRNEFRGLLNRASALVRVPPQPTRERAYEAGGLAMLDRSDVLVAIWDGGPGRGRGGTSAIVSEARTRAIPLAWVHAGNRHPETGQPTSLGVGQGKVTLERFPTDSGQARPARTVPGGRKEEEIGSMAAITIKRSSEGIVDSGRAYQVLVDGEKVGKVKRGESQSYPVDAGSHVVQLKVDWMRSRPVEVDVSADGDVELFCKPRGKPVIYLAQMIFQAGNYIELRPVPAGE